MNICECCKVEFNPKGYSLKNAHKQRFCSKSCSNKSEPRKKLTNKCINCKCLIGSEITFCEKCAANTKLHIGKRGGVRVKNNFNIIETQTLELLKPGVKDYLKYSKVRASARKKCKSIISNNHKCQVCGYDKLVELHHIKPISTFTKNTLVKEINDLTNLVLLCPNHHAEVDNNLFELPTDLHVQKLMARTGVEPAH